MEDPQVIQQIRAAQHATEQEQLGLTPQNTVILVPEVAVNLPRQGGLPKRGGS